MKNRQNRIFSHLTQVESDTLIRYIIVSTLIRYTLHNCSTVSTEQQQLSPEKPLNLMSWAEVLVLFLHQAVQWSPLLVQFLFDLSEVIEQFKRK